MGSEAAALSTLYTELEKARNKQVEYEKKYLGLVSKEQIALGDFQET